MGRHTIERKWRNVKIGNVVVGYCVLPYHAVSTFLTIFPNIFTAALAIPFFILFAVDFAEGKSDWENNGKWELQLPGDIWLYFALIMLNFSWAFGCMYYCMTFDAKLYELDGASAIPIIKKSSQGLSNPALDTTSDVFDSRDY